jgi:hypothetical protein
MVHAQPSPRSPNNSSVSNYNPGYVLSPRDNRGKVPKRYIPEDGSSKEYKITNYVATKHLPEKLRSFCDNSLSLKIPNSMQEAKQDPKCLKAMEVEMEALMENKI